MRPIKKREVGSDMTANGASGRQMEGCAEKAESGLARSQRWTDKLRQEKSVF